MNLPAGILHMEPFVPHPLETLDKTFPTPLPEAAYKKYIAEYEALRGVDVFRIIYRSDGLKVTGLMAIPTNASLKSHPVMIYNRGGNQEFGKLTLLSVLRNMVPFAKEGYLVFASNYRGNDGGEGREEFGGGDVNDVLNLLTIARNHPAFDGKNAFMVGHSRGGMMTYLALKHGASVNAAVVIAAMTDIRQAGIERPEMEQHVFMPLVPGEGRAREKAYDDRSPILWAQELSTPLLLLHGDADERVDVGHSVRMAETLKSHKKAYELVIYPKGLHALQRYWTDVTQHTLDWCRQWSLA